MSTAISQAAKLKPEIRLAQALSQFCADLDERRAREFKTLQTASPPCPDDVIRLTEEINRDGVRTHKAWRPHATSMALFLEKIQTLARIGDFLLGSSQNLTASGVWATVKITLGIAVSSLTFFKRLSELFLKVGRSSSITRDLVDVYPKSKELQDHMCEYLVTLVTFSRKIIHILHKPTIFQLASPFVAFFDKEAVKFEVELAHWSTAIDRRVMVLLNQRQLDAADTVARIGRSMTKWTTSEGEKRHQLTVRSKELQDKLCSRQSERTAAWRRQRKKGTTHWLFKEKSYQDWKNATKTSIMLIHGKLGSGKTVLLANVVAELYEDYPNSNTYEHITGSLFQQIIACLDPEDESVRKLSEYYQRALSPSVGDEAISILRNTLPRQRPIFIVIDALDECDGEQVGELLGAVRSIAKSVDGLHLCCSTRADAPVSQVLRSIFPEIDHQISMSPAALTSEMKSFVEAEFERRRHIRVIDKLLETIIKDVLVGASEGMYLWVALQIEALLPLHTSTLLSQSDIVEQLENLPKDLSEAFDRALASITDTRYGNKIFQLIASARRPLTVAELRIALHVEPGNIDWISISLPQNDKAIAALCGGGLLEIDEEDDKVRFIHHSVFQHLTTVEPGQESGRLYTFHKGLADILMGKVCVTYLNYSIFDTTLATTSNTFLNTGRLAKEIMNVAGTETSIAAKIISAIKGRRSSLEQDIDIGQLLQRYLEPNADTSELLNFLNYAHGHWLWHTVAFCPKLCGKTYKLYQRLIASERKHVDVAWFNGDLDSTLAWAWENKHPGVLLATLSMSEKAEDIHLMNAFARALCEANTPKIWKTFDKEQRKLLEELSGLALDEAGFEAETDSMRE